MNLTRTERLILANQYHILGILEPESAQRYSEMETVLQDGYEGLYGWVAQNIYERTLDAASCERVEVILQMYSALQYSYKELADKSGIDAKLLKFPGFDGNHEPGYLSYAEFFTSHDRGRFVGLDHEKDFNSHCPMLDTYSAMLNRWGNSADNVHLTKEEIIAIISR